MIFICIFLLMLLAACIYFILTNSKKNTTLKRQLILLTKQNDSLRNKVFNKITQDVITINYKIPHYKWGIITKDCSLYISPLEGSPTINNLKEGIKVYIVDSANLNSELWFQININSLQNINNKGWIKEELISFIEIENKSM